MLLHIVARGRIGRSPEAELVDRYLKRIAWPVRVTELPDTGGKLSPEPPLCRRVVLDEKGEALGSMAAKLVDKIKAQTGRTPRVEGLPTADWVLIDAGDVIVHLFRPEVRSFYNLEKMWAFGDAPPPPAPAA